MNNQLITSKDFNKILNFAISRDLEINTFIGSLQDEAIIYTNGERLLKNSPKTKYIILKEVYINSWSSGLKLIFTNSDKKAKEFLTSRLEEN